MENTINDIIIFGRRELKYVQDQPVYHIDGLSPCLRAASPNVQIALCNKTRKIFGGGTTMDGDQLNIEDIRIRKLTPRECFRLMAFDDEDFDNAAKVNSNSQLYKQAGNSIVVSCLEAIIGQMIEGKEDEWKERWKKK